MSESLVRPSSEPQISLMHLRLLLNSSMEMGQSLEPQEVAERALSLAFSVVGLKIGMVLVLEEGRCLILASRGLPHDWLRVFQSAALNLEGTLIQQALETDLPKVFSDLGLVADDTVAQFLGDVRLQSVICLPLRVPGEARGILLMGSQQRRVFQVDEVDILQAIASQLSTGLRNAWLFGHSWRQLEELESVTDIARTMVSSLDSNQILTFIVEEVMARLNTETAALLLLDEVQQELEFAAVAGAEPHSLKGTRLQIGQGVAGWVAQHNSPILVPDVTRDPRFYTGLYKETAATVTRTILAVPLRARDRLIGVIEVINKRQGQFSGADQRLMESLATFAAIAIENARLYEEVNRQTHQASLYARDLSLAYQRERKQREALDRLRFSFLNVVSHELKTPLTVILLGLETIRNPQLGPLNASQAEIVQTLDRHSDYLRRLLNGLITFATFSARQDTMNFKEAAFAAVLDDALTLSKFKAARKGITLEDQRLTALPTLSLDKDRLAEAIAHLVDNAVKFSPAMRKVVVQSGMEGAELVVRVIDRGCGIAADQIDRIWDSFTQLNTTLERGLEGLGLGLAIARLIIEAHSGTISVESELGKGSTFTVRLPCSALDAGNE
jgi:signal transduction histidine kinase